MSGNGKQSRIAICVAARAIPRADFVPSTSVRQDPNSLPEFGEGDMSGNVGSALADAGTARLFSGQFTEEFRRFPRPPRRTLRGRFIPVIILACGLGLPCSFAFAADQAATQPVRAGDGSVETIARPASSAAVHSQFDSEPIRRGGEGGGSGSPTPARPQSMELPRVAGALAIVISMIFLLRWGGKKAVRDRAGQQINAGRANPGPVVDLASPAHFAVKGRATGNRRR